MTPQPDSSQQTPRHFSLLRGFAVYWLIFLFFMIVDSVHYGQATSTSVAVRVTQLATIPVTALFLWALSSRTYTRKASYWAYFTAALVLQLILSLVCPVWW